jgi:hypothetical protein
VGEAVLNASQAPSIENPSNGADERTLLELLIDALGAVLRSVDPAPAASTTIAPQLGVGPRRSMTVYGGEPSISGQLKIMVSPVLS